MPQTQQDIQARLQQLRADYARRLPEKLAQIASQWDYLCAQPPGMASYEVLIREFHTLAGSGTSFGFPEVTRLARQLEQRLKATPDPDSPPAADERAEIDALLKALRHVAAHGPDSSVLESFAQSTEDGSSANPQLVYVLEDDPRLAEEIRLQLQHYGYQIELASSREQLQVLMQANRPGALIIDIVLPDDNGLDILRQIQDQIRDQIREQNRDRSAAPIPAIVISNMADTRERLQAIRAGASAFFDKPLDFAPLIDKLDHLTHQKAEDPYRILIMDDSINSAEFYAFCLQQAGMQTRVVTRPFEIMTHIHDFNPELILMDVYMPDCKGTELATMIRQQENYVSTPIVFLSSETDLEEQLLAMQQGGDDYLTKPIKPAHLVMSVKTRADRYRKLRTFMVRDSLTGLYNHTNIKEMLQREFSRSKRSQASLCYAMIDIDHFKAVNDNYGHATGDKVIKILARLLKQRLRKSDIIGRYGGEEFAVIFPDKDCREVEHVINEIRQSFEAVQIRHGDQEVNVTFSAGLACFPAFTSAEALHEQADQALYRAKQAGRNRVVVAGTDQD